jgi:putative protease
MRREIELLAPGGDVDSIKAAILAGANAVYCGLDKFNARGRAKNITIDDLNGILRLAHSNDCEVFLTVNIIIIESEIPSLIKLLNKLVNTQLDGIIVQDLGMFYLLNRYYPNLKIHASTQLTTHNAGQIKFLNRLNATRVNLSRELNINEIQDLSSVAHQHDMLIEVFVHGSNCISFSGLCYMSSVHGGNSGNRGRCSQPCRDQYLTTAEGKDFPLNIKDNSAYSDLRALADAGVDSIKIEGRIKKYHYVYTVVDTWRQQLQSFYAQDKVSSDNSDLRKVFNRDFSNSFLKGEVSRDTFIDNPRDNSAIHRAEDISEAGSSTTAVSLATAKKELYDIKTEIINDVKDRIDKLSIQKASLTLSISGKPGTPLFITASTPDALFEVTSESCLVRTNQNSSNKLDTEFFLSRFKAINNTSYFIAGIDLKDLDDDLFISFNEITAIKKQILFKLNGSRDFVSPIDMPRLRNPGIEKISSTLSLLISSRSDIALCDKADAEIYFELPNSFKDGCTTFVEIFNNNKQLIPWFPAVLIGDDYNSAVELLEKIHPERIVTNNSGIAYEAFEKGISWLAGPQLNLVNSFSLLCLKENFNCAGAFISNEINRQQIKGIKKPDGFKLIYSIYHPIVLMTSKVCFFHQVTGCKKNIVDGSCIQKCEKSSFITNLKEVSFFIKKTKGNYHSIYNETNFLNADIVTDIPNLFDSFFIDLRDMETDTKVEMDKLGIVNLFEDHLNGNGNATNLIQKTISPSTNTQYRKGI